jgi:hypothetical protein
MYEMRWPDFVREPAMCISAPAPILTWRRITGDYPATRAWVAPDRMAVGSAPVRYARLGLRLTNRREFLQGAVWAALPVVVGAPLLPTAARAAVPRTFPMVLIDDRHAEARAFGTALAAWGALVHAVPKGDVTALWRESIGPAWRQAPTVVAGLTRSPALFCLEQLGWELGRRVVFCAEHLVWAGRPVRHKVLRTMSVAERADEIKLSMRGRLWPSHLASMVAIQSALANYPKRRST